MREQLCYILSTTYLCYRLLDQFTYLNELFEECTTAMCNYTMQWYGGVASKSVKARCCFSLSKVDA